MKADSKAKTQTARADDLNDPQALRFPHSHTLGVTEKIAFDSKDPFLMMMEANRDERRRKKDSLEFTDTTECFQRGSERERAI